MHKKRALITGSSRGLGKHLVTHFELADCDVFRHARTGNMERDLIGDITNNNFYDSLESFIRNNRINIFVNNAAIHEPKAFLEYSQNDIQTILETNLASQILMIQRVYKVFIETRSGIIVNINSLAGRNPSANETIYCASKYGMRGFSESLQIESIGKNVKILDFYPGAMKTDMCKNRENYDNLMDPYEVAGMICTTVLRDDVTILPTEMVIRKFLLKD